MPADNHPSDSPTQAVKNEGGLPMPAASTQTESDSQPLPPPPSFGKQALQLFIIPALIVIVALVIIVPIARLASSRDTIEDQLAILKSGGGLEKDRWTAAHRIATMIPTVKDATQRAEVHAELARILAETPADDKNNDLLRGFLILALGRLGEPGGLPTVLSYADAPAAPIRQSVAQAVLEWPHREEARQAIPQLLALLNDSQNQTRVLAAQALGLLAKPDDPGVIEQLLKVQRDHRSDRELAWNASVALAKLGVPEGSRLVADVLLDRAALATLSDIADDGSSTGRTLSELQQTHIIQRTLIHTSAMTDQVIWDKIKKLAEEDSDKAVRTQARALTLQKENDQAQSAEKE